MALSAGSLTTKLPPPEAPAVSDARQLLGIKGASGTTNIWKLRLQLMKPVTWIPLLCGVICGAAASGQYQWRLPDVLAAAACMVMSGPLLTGYTQTINDYYDREIDAINEPYRPIPSGAIPLTQVKLQIWMLLLGGLAVAYGLDLYNLKRVMHGKQSEVKILDSKNRIYKDLPKKILVGRYHSWAIQITNTDPFLVTAISKEDVVMSFEHKIYPLTGIQYHPESILTNYGKDFLANWLKN